MPRRRMIDPSIWTDARFLALTDQEQKLFLGLISNADDEGRLDGNHKTLRAKLWANDDEVTGAEIRKRIESLCRKNPNVQWYVGPDGQEYLWLRRFLRWQTIRVPTASILPAAPAGYTNTGELPYPHTPDYTPAPSDSVFAGPAPKRRGRPKEGDRAPDQTPAPKPAGPAKAAGVAVNGGAVFAVTEDDVPWEQDLPDDAPWIDRVDLAFQAVSNGHRPLMAGERQAFERLVNVNGWDPEYLAYAVQRITDSRIANGCHDPVHSVDYYMAALANAKALPMPPGVTEPEPATPTDTLKSKLSAEERKAQAAEAARLLAEGKARTKTEILLAKRRVEVYKTTGQAPAWEDVAADVEGGLDVLAYWAAHGIDPAATAAGALYSAKAHSVN